MHYSVHSRRFLILAGFFGLLAVGLGAFGAHGLENILEPNALQRYQTGVQYQFYHTFALLVTGLWLLLRPSRALCQAGYMFSVGIVLFSGSLYLYALTSIKAFAILTPFGGGAFMVGWLLILYSAGSNRINAE